MNEIKNNEADIIDLLVECWIDKYKIIAIGIITCLVIIMYNFFIDKKYTGVSELTRAKYSTFTEFQFYNNVIEDHNWPDEQKITPDNFFAEFLLEFNDYDEMKSILRSNSFMQQKTKDSNEADKKLILNDNAKLFLITPIYDDKAKITKTATISYEWHDPIEGSRLLNDALQLTLKNTKRNILSNVNIFIDHLEAKRENEREKYYTTLDIIKKHESTQYEQRVKYLTEQSEIARTLGFEKSQINTADIKTNKTGNISQDESPYYLRGYKALDKEKEIIVKRTLKERHLMSDEYRQVSRKILEFNKKSLYVNNLKKLRSNIENSSGKNWVLYNLDSADIEVSNKLNLSKLFIFFLIGILLGVIFILFSNALKRRNYN
tara:strand:- start:7181 stop:8308 length:1128 start_codon:yes stop_codon:yes gene_type:complete